MLKSNPLMTLALQAREMTLFARKLDQRISSLNVGYASSNAEVIQQITDECRKEARKEAIAEAKAAGVSIAEIPEVTSIPHPSVSRNVSPTKLKIVSSKPKKRKFSAEQLRKLAEAREAYFRKKGFGKFAKTAKAKKSTKKRAKKAA